MSNLLKFLVLLILIDFVFAKINKYPLYVYFDKLLNNFNAQTIPPFFIFIQNEDRENGLLKKHENVHFQQYKKYGSFVFIISYLYEYYVYGYDNMAMEQEARRITGENEFCIKNYTFCVKNGLAITVQEKNF